MSDYHSKWQNDTNFRLGNPSPVTVDEVNESIRNTVREKSAGNAGGGGALIVLVVVFCGIVWSIPYLANVVDFFKGNAARPQGSSSSPVVAAVEPSSALNPPASVSESPAPPELLPVVETPAVASKTPAEDPETKARGRLDLALRLMKTGKVDAARRWLREIVEQYPGTKAAEEAQSRLSSMNAR